ncbi:MAG: histidine kinase [Planctomycetota bacterium]|nr:MAG: histidine kinase [Planctomycetota bacterium]REK38462.1 MAG: histidine kinase [Planctomycetota bacterium]
MRKAKTGGGWGSIRYTLRKAREAGGLWRFYKALRSKNACKTCAVGMGGQRGGMVNEGGHFPEVCVKAMQAMAADMQGAVRSDFFSTFSLAQLQRFTPLQLETSGRLTEPVLYKRGSDHYRSVSWDDALRMVVDELKSLSPDETFWYFSGRSSNEAGFLLQLLARLYGTNNVNNCSYYCHQASGVGLTTVTGSGTATLVLDDVAHADLVFLIGGNPASNHPRLMTQLKNVRRRGGKVIVVNPVVEPGLVNFSVPSDLRSLFFGSEIASQYVQPHIGGDLALLTGIAKRILELGAIDTVMLEQHCQGWPELRDHLAALDWQEIVRKSGVEKSDIDEMADTYAAASNVVFAWTMGITHHANGVQNVQAIGNLALLRGMVGRPHAGLLPIRGHSNIQGIGSVGVSPKLKDAVFDRLQEHFHVELPTTPGLDTLACMEEADAGRLKFGLCLGGNLYGSNPDANFAAAALGKLKTLVYLSTTLNTGHAHGLAERTLILPVLARDEEPQPTTQESMFNFVRLSDGGPSRYEGPKSEVEVIASLGEGLFAEHAAAPVPLDWTQMRSTSRIREAIAAIVPGFEKIADIDRTKQEFQIEGRTFHAPQFATVDGRARLHIHDLPELIGENGSDAASTPSTLRLMTVRSEGQFNTVVYEEYDRYRGQDARDVILLHPDDIARLGLEAEQRVDVSSSTGRLDGILVRCFEDIRAGNALMYYPEANVLVPRTVDPASRTPAFKNVTIQLAPSAT